MQGKGEQPGLGVRFSSSVSVFSKDPPPRTPLDRGRREGWGGERGDHQALEVRGGGREMRRRENAGPCPVGLFTYLSVCLFNYLFIKNSVRARLVGKLFRSAADNGGVLGTAPGRGAGAVDTRAPLGSAGSPRREGLSPSGCLAPTPSPAWSRGNPPARFEALRRVTTRVLSLLPLFSAACRC